MRSLVIIKKFLLALQGLDVCKINTRRSLLKLGQERVLFFVWPVQFCMLKLALR